MSILAQHISKSFGAFQALNDVTVEAPSGELVALLGPSGSGKTTLLRVIAGLEFPDEGTILFEGADATTRTAKDRNVGFVFQHYALFRHMTIFENIAFSLRVRNRPQAEVADRVGELLKLIQLEGIGNRYPHQLSGGQRQRVALARALAGRPKVLLLDEPFGALDAQVRKDLRRWLRKLHDEIHVTSLFVTHDQEEALEVADRVVIMNKGRVEQMGTPDEVYNKPANPFVLSFLGHVNIFHGRVRDGEATLTDGATMVHKANGENRGKVAAYVRPHEIELTRERPAGKGGTAATVAWIHRAGATIKVELKTEAESEGTDGGLIVVELPRAREAELNLQPGERVYAVPRDIRIFEGDFQI
jgi:sulfate transport system ATP-binding protein